MTLRNMTVVLCAALLLLWLFRIYYQSAGTATLSARQRVVPGGGSEGRERAPETVGVKPVKKRPRSPDTGRPVRDSPVKIPDETQPNESDRAPVEHGEGGDEAVDEDVDDQAGTVTDH